MDTDPKVTNSFPILGLDPGDSFLQLVAPSKLMNSTESIESVPASKRYIRGLVQGRDFEVLEFLKQTSRISSSELKKALETSADDLQNELASIVNDDFHGFIKLFNDIGAIGVAEFEEFSNKLYNIDKGLQSMERCYSEELKKIQQVLSKMENQIIERKKSQVAYQLDRDLGKLENLLNISSSETVDLEIASEIFSRLKYRIYHSTGKIEIPEDILYRFTDLSSKFHTLLDDFVSISLKDENGGECWGTVAGIAIKLGKGKSLSVSFWNEFWRPRVIKIANKERFEIFKKRGLDNPLSSIFSELIISIKEIKPSWFKDISDGELFLACVIFPLFQYLCKELIFIFSPAIPDTFHANFTQSCIFINEICNLLDDREKANLDTNVEFQNFVKSWQLNIYYQLRFRDFAQKVEDSLAALNGVHFDLFKEMVVPKMVNDHPCLNILTDLLKQMVSEKICLKPLLPKFFRLQLQTVARIAIYFCNFTQGKDMTTNSTYISLAWYGNLLIQRFRKSIIPVMDQSILLFDNCDKDKLNSLSKRFWESLDERIDSTKAEIRNLTFNFIIQQIESLSADNIADFKLCILFKNSLISSDDEQQVIEKYVNQCKALLNQSKKSVINYRRLKTIMKHDDAKLKDSSNKEEQHEKLVSLLTSQIKESVDYCANVENLNEFGSQLEQLLTEIGGEI